MTSRRCFRRGATCQPPIPGQARVRERKDGEAFYILLLTAKTQKEDIVAGLLAGADDYITKPFSPGRLVERVHGLLKTNAS